MKKKLSSVHCRMAIVMLFAILEANAGIFTKRKLILKRGIKLDNCSPSPHDDPVKIRDLDVFTTKNGDLDISGLVMVGLELNDTIKAMVTVHRRVLGSAWLPMPCIQGLGSCTYDNLCQYGVDNDVECPPIFAENDVPCRCPVEPGKYLLPGGQFVAGATYWAGVMAGTYRAKVILSQNDEHLGCYNATFKLE